LKSSQVFLTKLNRRLDASDAGGLRADLPDVEVDICVALEIEETYIYCRVPATVKRDSAAATTIKAVLGERYPGNETAELKGLQDIPGASSTQVAHWHYVVETDVVTEATDDLNAWYNEEHLPGLASVEGTVHAWRFQRPEGQSPRYHACYDLATVETFGSPPWIAVRSSEWSSRVRPSFRNTKRTMFKKLP
jgi:hypothetical protein